MAIYSEDAIRAGYQRLIDFAKVQQGSIDDPSDLHAARNAAVEACGMRPDDFDAICDTMGDSLHKQLPAELATITKGGISTGLMLMLFIVAEQRWTGE